MQFFVQTLGKGKTFVIEAEPDDTIASVKQQIMDKGGIDPSTQNLIFEGKQLEDGHMIKDFKFANTTTVHLVIRAPATES